MQRCKSVQRPTVRVSLAVKQKLGHARMTAVRGHVERGQIVDGHLVHRGLVVEEYAGCINMVTLNLQNVYQGFSGFQ